MFQTDKFNNRPLHRVACLAVLFLVCGVTSGADLCIDTSNFTFLSQNGQIEVADIAITIRGLNWWGIEGDTFTLGGLNVNPLTWYLDFMQENGFNGLRIPYTLDMALNPTKRFPTLINYAFNLELQNMTTVEVMDVLFEEAAKRGILIVLNQHNFVASETSSDETWFGDRCITNLDGVSIWYTTQDTMNGWNFMVNRYKKFWNFVGCDLVNEPHGVARWGTGDVYDWALASGQIGDYIFSLNPDYNGLMFVEGVELNPQCEVSGAVGCENCTGDGHWWGGNMEGIRCAPCSLSKADRVVYSPHVYGYSVYDQPYFQVPDFPNNLPALYDDQFGFVVNQTGRAVVIGEWGGPLNGPTLIIENVQSAYFQSRNISSSFYWALNPNPGGDTDGILQADWTTPTPGKIQFLQNAHPTPTIFNPAGNQVCISVGQPARNPITVTLNPGTNFWWLGLTVQNDDGPTVAVSMMDFGSYTNWTNLTWATWGAWILPSNGVGFVPPVSLRLYSSHSQIDAFRIITNLSDILPINTGVSFTTRGLTPTNKPSALIQSSDSAVVARPILGCFILIAVFLTL